MKSIIAQLCILVALLMPFYSFGQGINFAHGSWDEIKAKAKAENKHIFVDAYAVWCGPCKWMAKNVFTDKAVGALYNKSYVSYKFDMEKGEGPGFSEEFKIEAYPTLLYFSPEGKLVHKIVGGMAAESFVEEGEKALDENEQTYTLLAKYKAGDKSQDLLYKLALAMSNANEDATEIASTYLENTPKEQYKTEDNFDFIRQMIQDYTNPVAQYVMDNKESFIAASSKEDVEEFMLSCYYPSLTQILRNKEPYNNFKPIFKSLKKQLPEKAPALIARVKMNYYRDDAKKAFKYTKVYAEKHCDNSQELNSFAWGLYEETKDAKKLKIALKWVEKSIQLEKNPYNLDTKAYILHAMGKNTEALSIAKEALQLAEGTELDMSGTIELINKLKK